MRIFVVLAVAALGVPVKAGETSPLGAASPSAAVGVPFPRMPVAGSPAAGNPVLCGCAAARFLPRVGAVVDESRTYFAWLHGGARIVGFRRGDGGPLVESDLPMAVDHAFVGNGKGASLFDLSREVQAGLTADEGARRRLTGDGSGLVRLGVREGQTGLLGIVKARESAPRDVVDLGQQAPPATAMAEAAPLLRGLWLRPPEERQRRDCGSWTTMRIAFELASQSVPVEAFVVRDLSSGSTSLVDARHAGAFGLGYVAVCRHGFPVGTAAQTLEVTPVSASGMKAEPWVVHHDGLSTSEVRFQQVPPSASPDALERSFPVPGQRDRQFSWLSVGGMWILSAALGLVCGVIGFLLWRFRRRRLRDVRCASCSSAVPVDVLDPRTDGFFCPACGAAGIWKGSRGVAVDVTRLAKHPTDQ
jgi:hypothetical protein